MSEVLTLRRYKPADRDWFVRLFSDPVVMARTGGASSTEQAAGLFDVVRTAHEKPGEGRVLAAWVAEDAAQVRLAHAVLLRSGAGVEIGFIVPHSAWGRGIATQVARELVRLGFAVRGIERLIATVDVDHVASKRVLEKAGFAHVRCVEDDEGLYDLYEIKR